QSDGKKDSFARRWRFGTEKGRARLRRKLLAGNPALWLARRDRFLTRVVWVVLLAAATVLPLIYKVIPQSYVFAFIGQAVYYLLALAVLLWVSAQASRFFVEARRNGALELMLVTPL